MSAALRSGGSEVPASADPAAARLAGLAVLALAGARTALSAAPALEPPRRDALRSVAPLSEPRLRHAVRLLQGAAAMLGLSVLADSGVEHYRGSFENPGMLAPLVTSAATIVAGASGALAEGRPSLARRRVFRTAIGVGAAGTAFHIFNLLRRPGRLNWQNLFYGAPLGAPAALSLAGLVGSAAEALLKSPEGRRPDLLGLPAGRALAGLAGAGIAGTTAEAALLHFRGAFHNPFMAFPVTLPPVTAACLAALAVAPGRQGAGHGITRALLGATAVMGMAGVAFHAYGVSRAMGGWRNWSQNVIDGPPLPAPPAFSALALVGLAALSLLEARGEVRP